MIDSTIYVSSHFGRTIRALLETCDGVPLTSADVRAMRYSIEQKGLRGRTAVTGHTNVTIPAESLLDTTQEADNGEPYNLEFQLDATTKKPFPLAGGVTYVIIIGVTLEADGKEYGNEQEVVTL